MDSPPYVLESVRVRRRSLNILLHKKVQRLIEGLQSMLRPSIIKWKTMKSILSFLLLLCFISACAAPVESTPAPYPDTPSPAEINAPLVESPALVSIQFLNELDGWGVTETQIVRTNDGGITWYNVTPTEVTEAGYSVDTFVLDNNHVWMQLADLDNFPNSGSLYRTTDGGLT